MGLGTEIRAIARPLIPVCAFTFIARIGRISRALHSPASQLSLCLPERITFGQFQNYSQDPADTRALFFSAPLRKPAQGDVSVPLRGRIKGSELPLLLLFYLLLTMYPRFSLLIPAHTLVVHKLWEAGSNLKAVNSNRSPSALGSFFLFGFFLISVCCVLFCFAITEALTKHSVFFVSFQLSLLISNQNLAFEWIWKATRELTHGWEPCLSYLLLVKVFL